MPDFYVSGPGGAGPLNWHDEQSGVLRAAMMKFFDVARRREFGADEFELVRAYGEYYIKAPCWDANPHNDDESRAKLAALRTEIAAVKDVDELDNWIAHCLEVGLDPY